MNSCGVIVDHEERSLDSSAAAADLSGRVAEGEYEESVWSEGIVVLRRVAEPQ